MLPGQLHHVEYYVNDLARSNAFWSWFLTDLGYRKAHEWSEGVSWAHSNGTYLIFVQTQPEHLSRKNNRQGNGLNHIAFVGKSREHVHSLKTKLVELGLTVTHHDDQQICFEDPNDFAVEVYVPKD